LNTDRSLLIKGSYWHLAINNANGDHYLTSLRIFLKEIDEKGELLRITEEIDPYLEAAAVIDSFDNGPAVLMENIKNYRNAVVAGVCNTRERLCQALKTSREELHGTLLYAIRNPKYPQIEEGKKERQYVHSTNLSDIPILRHYPEDGGRYITAAIVAARSLDGKIENVSFHRLQVLDENHLAIRVVPRHLYKILKENEKTEEPLEVAISIGLHPAIMLAAASAAPFGVSEYGVANTLLGGELVLCKCKDVNVPAPSEAEIILEGKIKVDQETEEGPFVDATGTYDIIRRQPVVEITGIRYQEQFIYQALLPGKSEHHLLMGLPREAQIRESISRVVPYVRGVNLTLGGCSWLHAIISLEKQTEGDGKSALLAAFTAHKSLKHAVVVDSDINPYDLRAVEWAIATRFQADRDLVLVKGARGSSLDPSGDQNLELTTKMGIDATRTLTKPEESFKKVVLSEPHKRRAETLLKKYMGDE